MSTELATEAAGTSADRTVRWIRRVLIAVGVAVMGYAITGALTASDVQPIGVAIFLGAMVVGHDGVFMPIVLGVGALIRRFVAPRWRATVQAAAVVTVSIVAISTPLVLGYGRAADNPSILPHAYGRNLILILVSVWVAAFLIRKSWTWFGRRRSR